MNNKIKIGSVILFTTVLGIVFALSFIIDNSNKEEIKFIELKGSYHLSQTEYMKFANIENQDSYSTITSKIIKDRFEKHPYIRKVDLLLSENTLRIEIFEKKFESLLMVNDKEFLISDDAVIIPKLPKSEKIDFPIISDPNNENGITEFYSATDNDDVKIGLKIITTLKIINSKLYENLSEINLRNGRDIILQFSNMNIPIVLGRNNEIKKIILFEKLMQKLDYNKIVNTLTYIDLRYSNYLYVGKSNSSNSEQEIDS